MNLYLFLMSKSGIVVFLAVLIVYLLLMTKLMAWNNRLLNDATAKFEAWLPQWVGENGWRLIEYRSEKGPRPDSWFYRRGMLYLRFVVRDQQEVEHVGWASYNFSPLGGGKINVRWETNDPSPQNVNPIAIK